MTVKLRGLLYPPPLTLTLFRTRKKLLVQSYLLPSRAILQLAMKPTGPVRGRMFEPLAWTDLDSLRRFRFLGLKLEFLKVWCRDAYPRDGDLHDAARYDRIDPRTQNAPAHTSS